LKVAVFGSRKGISEERVHEYLRARFDPNVILISGGAVGVDTFAEQEWLRLGGRVLSYRPIQFKSESYGVQLWKLGSWPEGPSVVTLSHPNPEWRTYNSALTYRSMLVAEEADRGVAFLAHGSRGTKRTYDFFEVLGKPCVIKEEADVSFEE
jgi:hypothetical protein